MRFDAMPEPAKRLTPTGETLRELFLKSGNLCAFPGCTHLMMNAEGVFVGQVCHIEAAEPGGERFNPAMTNERRRLPQNLVLMCYEHHVVTDDVEKYPVAVLHQFKADHEARFASPQRAMVATLQDWTRSEDPVFAKNLRRMNKVIGWDLSDEELAGSAEALNKYVERLQIVPMEVRVFLGKIAERAHRVRKTSAVAKSYDGLLLSCFDIEGSFRLSSEEVFRQSQQLSLYNLGHLDDMSTGRRTVPAILLRKLDGWPIWEELARFCVEADVPMEAFTQDLDFSRLDE